MPFVIFDQIAPSGNLFFQAATCTIAHVFSAVAVQYVVCKHNIIINSKRM